MAASSPKKALVLSGGGARGAYEAGVIRYIYEVLPDYLHERPTFEIISGTSVGAINAAWLAATANDPQRAVQRLWYLWRKLEFADVVKPSYREMWRMLRSFLGPDKGRSLSSPTTGTREGGILETGFFDKMVRREIPFHNIARNIQRGLLESVSVTATDIVTGQTTVFVQSRGNKLPPWTRDPRRIAVGGPLTPEKVLASAAIPILFPAIKLGKHWYCDGGLRQNTPVTPALRMGANRVLVISLQSKTIIPQNTPFQGEPHQDLDVEHPNIAFMIGKMLDALLLDPLDYDLAIIERINDLLTSGEEVFGDASFVDKVNEVIKRHRGQGYRVVEQLLLRPGHDLGQLAAEFASGVPEEFWGSKFMALVGPKAFDYQGYQESDFLSYLLFDSGYTSQLLDMGYADAQKRHDELVAFFSE